MGNKSGLAIILEQIALLDEEEDKYEDALERSRQAEEIFLQLGNQDDIARIQKQRQRLEELMTAKL